MDWDEKDEIFFPKRRVKNKFAGKHPHIIGTFFSQVNKRPMEYESLGENIFCNLLELDRQIQRYYVQPIEIKVPYIDSKGAMKTWIHCPDALVYRQGLCPHLFQIKTIHKDSATENNKKINIINKACQRHAYRQGWNYYTVYPKEMPEVIVKNIKFLVGFLKCTPIYDGFLQKLKKRLSNGEEKTISELAQDFHLEINSLQVIPAIYYLIANGEIFTDYYKPLNSQSQIRIFTEYDDLDILWKELMLTVK